MDITELVTTLENATELSVVNTSLVALVDTLLSNGTITEQTDLAKLARLRAQINIVLS